MNQNDNTKKSKGIDEEEKEIATIQDDQSALSSPSSTGFLPATNTSSQTPFNQTNQPLGRSVISTNQTPIIPPPNN